MDLNILTNDITEYILDIRTKELEIDIIKEDIIIKYYKEILINKLKNARLIGFWYDDNARTCNNCNAYLEKP